MSCEMLFLFFSDIFDISGNFGIFSKNVCECEESFDKHEFIKMNKLLIQPDQKGEEC